MGFGRCTAVVLVGAAVRVRVSVADLCCTSHESTYFSAHHCDNGGPLTLKNINAEICVTRRTDLKSVAIKFMALKPRSHSAVLTGIVLMQLNSGFNCEVICFPPLSL